MTSKDWLAQAQKKLEVSGIASARLDSLILLEDFIGMDRSWILAHADEVIENSKELDQLIERRANHEPLAYIRGKSEFYGREFLVTPATLQPRPETETMIELLLKQSPNDTTIVDIGTGSGCLAITAKLELPDIKVLATEINEDALRVAKKNAESLGSDVGFFQGNLLKPISNIKSQISNIVILANLPYVPNAHTINQAAMQEPKIAIFGGKDGLDLYREMFYQINELNVRPDLILTESLPFQHKQLTDIAVSYDFKPQGSQDLIQIFR